MICVDNLETGSLENIEHIKDDAFAFLYHDVVEPIEIDEPVDFVFHLAALASPIDYLRAPLAVAEGRLLRHAQRARARQVEARALPARLDERGLRRPAGASAARDLLGERQPDRPARRLRRGEALRRGADDGLPRPAGRRHRIARIFNTYGPRMRRNDGRAIRARSSARRSRASRSRCSATARRRGRFCYVDDLIRGLYLLATSERAPAGQHRQPRHELTMLELAQTVIRVTGSTSEIVFEALPVDDPQVRQPDITRARQVLGWEPEIDLEDGLRRWVKALGREPATSRPCAAGGWSSPCSPAALCRGRPPPRVAHMLVGIYDEAQTLYGRSTSDRHALKSLHAQELRASTCTGAARRRREATARQCDRSRAIRPTTGRLRPRGAVRGQYGIQVLFSVSGTPRWANGGRRSNSRPRTRIDLADFALAAATRYSGTVRRRPTAATLPRGARTGPPGTSRTTRSSSRPQYQQDRDEWVIAERGRLREDLQRGLRRRPRDAASQTSGSPAASPRRAGTTTRRAPAVGLAARVPRAR